MFKLLKNIKKFTQIQKKKIIKQLSQQIKKLKKFFLFYLVKKIVGKNRK